MTTSTQPKTEPCRTSYSTCPLLAQAPVSERSLFPLPVFKAPLNRTSVLLSLRGRSASVCPADRGQNHRPAGNHRERSLWRGVARALEGRRRGGEDLFVQRGAILVPRG